MPEEVKGITPSLLAEGGRQRRRVEFGGSDGEDDDSDSEGDESDFIDEEEAEQGEESEMSARTKQKSRAHKRQKYLQKGTIFLQNYNDAMKSLERTCRPVLYISYSILIKV